MQQPNDPRGAGVRPSEREFWTEGAERERVEDSWDAGSISRTEQDSPDTRSPRGDEYSSSAAPVGEGSNTPVGEESGAYRAWDADRPAPSRERFGTEDQGAWATDGKGNMMTWGASVAAGATVLGLLFAWWRRRRARKSRVARLREALMEASQRALLPAAARLPGAVGRAAGKARAPWLPFALLPLALWLRSSGRAGKKASDEMLEPLELEDRGTRLARRTADLVERRGKRWIREADPTDRGWGWTPWLLAVPAVGGAYFLARRWTGGDDSSGPASGGSSDWGVSRMARSATGSKQVRDVMTRGVEVISPDTTVDQVAMRMRDLDIGSLPVCDGTRLLGVITDRDLTIRTTATGKDPKTTAAREVMSPDIVWVFEDEPADRAAQIMRDRQIRRLPVLDRNDQLVGIVALGDLAVDLGRDRLTGETLEQISQPSRPR